MIPITAIIGTRNEEHKVATALTHCLRWADEVIVVDKSSTDRTREVAEAAFARVSPTPSSAGGRERGDNSGQTPGSQPRTTGRVVTVPFTRQGHESVEEQVSCASHDWVWIWTSHEVPTRACIETGRSLASDDVDLVFVPMRYYSFGIHHERSPWAGGYQPRLFNRRRVTFTGLAHDPLRAERIARLEADDSTYVLHQTHAPVDRFMLSHADYMVNEAAVGDPAFVFDRAMRTADSFDAVFRTHPELLPQALGWKIYWHGVALHAWERMHPGIPEQYAARCAAALKEWSPSPPSAFPLPPFAFPPPLTPHAS